METLPISELCAFSLRTVSCKWSLWNCKSEKLMLIAVLLWSSNISSCVAYQNRRSQNSYDGRFIGQNEAKAIALDSNTRLAKIPCNFTTKTNCIYVQQKQKLILPTNGFPLWTQQRLSGIVVSWVTNSDNLNKTGYIVGLETKESNHNINNLRDKKQGNLFNFNWIIELLACMMLASAFEVCLLMLRNLRNIGAAFFGFWSTLLIRIQMLCNVRSATSSNKSNQQQRKRNVAVSEKRTLSYIFAILTWRATQTAKCSGSSAQTTLRDGNANNIMSYGHVTTMGDLLLLILFTHVYYQRQHHEKGLNGEEEFIEESRDKSQNKNCNQQLYDKQNKSEEELSLKKRCSYSCGNTYQQITPLQECKFSQSKVAPVTSNLDKIPYFTNCSSGMSSFTCCFCQCSCRKCWVSCCYCRHCGERCYPNYTSQCSIIYCRCFVKFLKSLHDVNCCYLCCWQDVYNLQNPSSRPAVYHRCCHYYCENPCSHCYLCKSLTKKSIRALNFLLHSKSQYGSSICKLKNKNCSSFCLVYGLYMFVNNYNLCEAALKTFTSLSPQYLLTFKNYQNVLKWKRLQVALVIMSLLVVCASSRSNYDYQNFYNFLLKCKLVAKNKQNQKGRRRPLRLQHRKAYRPTHYFNTTPIQFVKLFKVNKLKKILIDKISIKSVKLQTSNITMINEQSLVTTSSKTSMVRSIKRMRGSKPNIIWLLIGLIWFEGPKIVNCNVIINYQNQQQHEQQHQQQQQQQYGNSHKETTTNSINSNFEYKTENFSQIKTKNNNSNNNNSNNKSKNKSKHTDNNSSNNSNNNESNNNRNTDSSNIYLPVNVIPVINTIHLKHCCNSNYNQNLVRSSQRFQRAFKSHQNLDTRVTSNASQNFNNNNKILDSQSDEKASSTLSQDVNEENHDQSDLMRLESIKHQILFKLGLTRKPNVSHTLPKQFIWDTIYRADGIKNFHEFANNFQDNILPHQSYPYWITTFARDSNVQRQNMNDEYSKAPFEADERLKNTKKSIGSIEGHLHKKNGKKLHQTKLNYYNDINYYNEATTTHKSQFIYASSSRKNLSRTNKAINNFTIIKQSKHQQQFHKNPQHLTTATTHQNRRQHKQINQYTDNNNKNHIHNTNNKNNNKNNNVNNTNNKYDKNNNNFIVVQKHLRNNNSYIEDAKKFTYLTDINSSDDSLKSVNYYSTNSDNNRIIKKQKSQNALRHEKTIESYDNTDHHHIDSSAAAIDVDINIDMNIATEANYDTNYGPGLYTHNDNHHFNLHDNYLSKLDALDENDEYFGSTQEIITFAEKGKMYKNHRLVEFSHQNSEKSKEKLHVRNAEIHIRIDKISRSESRAGPGIERKRLKIWIFQLVENNYTYKGFDHIAQFCASFEVDKSRLGWQKFDITTTAKEWYSQRENEKLRLLIDCTGCGKIFAVHLFNSHSEKKAARGKRMADKKEKSFNISDIGRNNFQDLTNYYPYNQKILIPESSNADVLSREDEDLLNSSRPFLVLHTEARQQRRVRRRAINCNGALHGQCCKESFYVSFKALGWDDWIIAPRGYFANYCRGDCTGPYRTPDTFQTFHAHFIEEYRKIGLLNGMQPCCAPIKFSSMSLIYYADEGIIKRDLPKMVVDECGCP